MTHQLNLFTAEFPELSSEGVVVDKRGGLPPQESSAAPKDGGKEMRSSSAVMNNVIALLPKAFDKVASNNGAPGPDRQDIEQVRKHLAHVLRELGAALRDGSYRPGMTRRVWIPKADGGQRALGIPNVVDRIVQTAVSMVLEPKCEQRFHPNSHGFRPGRSCHSAILQARDYVEQGSDWVVDIDLEKFFDTVNHQRLMARLAEIESDPELLKLVGLMLKARTVMPDGLVVANDTGVPQGGPLSALLSNIVLNELDWKLEERGHKFVRYADDCKIYVRSERAGQRVMASTSQWITKTLRLKVNAGKSAVARPRERHFVGFSLETNDADEVEIRLSERSLKRLRAKVVELTPRNWGDKLDSCIERLNSYLIGWLGFFSIVGQGELRTLRTIDAHIRRRLRAIMFKHWKRKQTMARRLTKMGARHKTAWDTVYAGSSRIWWLSGSSVANSTIKNAYFVGKGLVMLAERWNAKHSKITASGQVLLPGIV